MLYNLSIRILQEVNMTFQKFISDPMPEYSKGEEIFNYVSKREFATIRKEIHKKSICI